MSEGRHWSGSIAVCRQRICQRQRLKEKHHCFEREQPGRRLGPNLSLRLSSSGDIWGSGGVCDGAKPQLKRELRSDADASKRVQSKKPDDPLASKGRLGRRYECGSVLGELSGQRR